ncbi:MAG: thioredoxin family protein [Lentisphaerae bacterium]|nr:thioredoxin family protein [Lentisphaerota bacterium]MBT4820106.1 thioredoxin family protein [Lentisphaerota bacterium]MBT5607958.1 thioredoxin family protein [Lentisphaerota bacterium]MBT7057485.1 thioredoxin family protein [Lentisphaerota bacterium]MBT7845631.1 thioredoxin family protein [Lentisphaerota bacterium]
MAHEFLLIRNDPPCKKCHQVEDVLRETVDAVAFDVEIRCITTATEEARSYGALLTPMVLLDGKSISAGMVPRKGGLVKLLEKIHSEQADTV